MKILCIGNSFSSDATRYLQKVGGGELYVRNLYIGGCSLETHYNNIVENNQFYDYQIDDEYVRKAAIEETLLEDEWDFVTIQQVSHFSGMEETYEPYMTHIINFVRSKCPKAEIVFHRTWAYDDKSTHGGFASYDNDRKKMYNAIIAASTKHASNHGLRIIPCGDAIELARDLDEFRPGAALNMNRDGFHLSLDYGRYLAALTMYGFFTKKSPLDVTYEPDGTDAKINKKLKEIAHRITM
ncbi:MAG: DUF4886 domain-containing protein [Clostridia bacterium]|nr:DUF4886 domain-containing protein [Clostridia bacterium]MBQ7907859.1 DUF4886 domain-containing protein [Clostridia bacterium]